MSGCWEVLPGREGELWAFHTQGACLSFLPAAIQSHRPPGREHRAPLPPTPSFRPFMSRSIHHFFPILRLHPSTCSACLPHLSSPTYLSPPTSGERGLCFARCCIPGQCFLPYSRCLAHAQSTYPFTHSPCACYSFSLSIHFPSYICLLFGWLVFFQDSVFL